MAPKKSERQLELGAAAVQRAEGKNSSRGAAESPPPDAKRPKQVEHPSGSTRSKAGGAAAGGPKAPARGSARPSSRTDAAVLRSGRGFSIDGSDEEQGEELEELESLLEPTPEAEERAEQPEEPGRRVARRTGKPGNSGPGQTNRERQEKRRHNTKNGPQRSAAAPVAAGPGVPQHPTCPQHPKQQQK